MSALAMDSRARTVPDALSPWWRRAVLLIIVIGLGILLGLAGKRTTRLIEWCRLPGDAVFIGVGVLPAVIATALTYR